MSRKNTPFINSLPKLSQSVLTGAAFVRTRGIPSGTFILSCYFFQIHIAMPFGVLLQNKNCPPYRCAFLPHQKVRLWSHVLPKTVGGIGKGIGWVPANSRIIASVITTACCKGYRLGIGHTRPPMKAHLGQLKTVTGLRGRPGNYGHVKAIVRALL